MHLAHTRYLLSAKTLSSIVAEAKIDIRPPAWKAAVLEEKLEPTKLRLDPVQAHSSLRPSQNTHDTNG